MKKRTAFFFLFVLILFLFFLSSDFVLAREDCEDGDCGNLVCREGKCVRPLEIVYPQIPGVPTLSYVTTGLPQYIEYIFRFAVIIIGFIIFAVLIYNGVIYLISVGNPAKLANARSGILAGFLGALILLLTYIIFNTINPQLVIFDPAEIQVLGGIIRPGVYLCNYKVSGIGSILDNYITGTTEQRTEAAEKLKEAIDPPDVNLCLKVESSGNFREFDFSGYLDNTWFMVPVLSGYNSITTKYEGVPKFNYGIVLHEKKNFGGKCFLLPASGDNSFEQGKVTKFHLNLLDGFRTSDFRSVTLFQRLPSEKIETQQGTVTLYDHVRFNEEVKAGEEKNEKSFYNIVNHEILKTRKQGLQVATTTLSENTRSIKIDGPVFTLLFEDDNFGGKCELIKNSDSNLEDNPIGRCGGCYIIASWFVDCEPCLRSMISVKGTTL